MVTIQLGKKILIYFFVLIALSYFGLSACTDDCNDTHDICHDTCDDIYDNCTSPPMICLNQKNTCDNNCNDNRDLCIASCGAGNDTDGDGVDDSIDTIIGDETSVYIEGLENLAINIGGISSTNPAASALAGIQNVTITSDSTPIVEITVDFDNANLDLTSLEIKKQRVNRLNGIIIKGLRSSGDITKTIYLEQHTPKSGICVADKEIDSITDISMNCNEEDEYFFGRCHQSETIGDVSCNIQDGMFKISGLRNSGAVELNFTGLYTGYFTVEYTNELSAHQDGYIMPGEKVRICFESQRGIREDEYMRFIFAPQYGQYTVKEIYTPEILTVYNVHLYPG